MKVQYAVRRYPGGSPGILITVFGFTHDESGSDLWFFPELTETHYVLEGSHWTKGLAISVNGDSLRLVYPDPKHTEGYRLTTASTELKSLCALFFCNLAPAGVVADLLEEEFEEHKEAADILRLYEKVKQEVEIAKST